MKQCEVCEKGFDQTSRNPKQAVCRPCFNNKKLFNRHHRLRYYYGITLPQYNSILEKQGGGCAICGSINNKGGVGKSLCVDHDHDSGKIRGILCSTCNRAIGQFNDDVETVKQAVAYLESARTDFILSEQNMQTHVNQKKNDRAWRVRNHKKGK